MLAAYPKKMQGGFNRSFNREWFKTYPWLEYSKKLDAVFCFACRHFARAQSGKTFDPAFTSAGFSNWKKAKEANKGLGAHADADTHTNAMVSWTDYQSMKSADTSITQMVSKAHQKTVEENRHYVKTMADILLFTAMQDTAQRGHDESKTSLNQGNFVELLKLIGKHDPVIARKAVELPQNAKYTSPQIQNEVLQILADMVRKEILEEVKEAGEFSLMADETKDVAKTEQISFVLRYFYKGSVHESFLTYKAAESLNAEGLSKTIVSTLESFGLDYKENLVGQGYDGAAVMSGKLSGVSTRISGICKYAIYIHCHAHILNLVLVDAAKAEPEVADFFSLLSRLYVFLSGSYVHIKWKRIQEEMYTKKFELQRLSDTRWACRYYACHAIYKRLPAILKVLDEIAAESGTDRATDARGLKAQLDFRFLLMLSLFDTILGKCKSASDMFQSRAVDLAKATDIVAVLKEEMKTFRSQSEGFETMWEDAVELAKSCNLQVAQDDERITRTRRPTKTPARLQDSVLLVPAVEHRCGFTKDTFRVNICYPVLDKVLSELDKRFSNQNCTIMQGIQALNPTSDDFLVGSKVQPLAETFDCNMDDLMHELHQAKRLVQRKVDQGLQGLTSLVDFASFLEPYKDAFHELYRLSKIAVTLPVTSASCERSFSALKLIKTYLRNSMSDARVSNLATLHIERSRSRAIDLDDFVDVFANSHNNRKITLI